MPFVGVGVVLEVNDFGGKKKEGGFGARDSFLPFHLGLGCAFHNPGCVERIVGAPHQPHRNNSSRISHTTATSAPPTPAPASRLAHPEKDALEKVFPSIDLESTGTDCSLEIWRTAQGKGQARALRVFRKGSVIRRGTTKTPVV